MRFKNIHTYLLICFPDSLITKGLVPLQIMSYLAERVEQRLKSTCVLGRRLDFVDVDGTAARQRSIRTDDVAEHDVVVTAVTSRSQILRHTHEITH